MRVWVWIQRQESPTSLTAMIKEQCITVSSRLSRQIKDYSSAGNEPDLAPGEQSPLTFSRRFLLLFIRRFITTVS